MKTRQEFMTRDKHATIVGNCVLKLQDTTNRSTRVKEKSQLPFPLIKDLLIAKKLLEKLRLLGNYHHNLTVLEVGKGELIVSRCPSTTKRCNPNDFLPCAHCLGFRRRQELWKHVKSCKFKSKNVQPLALTPEPHV